MTTTTTTEDIDELKSVLRGFLSSHCPSTRVREIADSTDAVDWSLWQRMVDELALPGLAIPEEFGGGGYDASVQLAVFEELGRALACVPYLSTVGMAIPALLASGTGATRSSLLTGIAAGTTTATAAFLETDAEPATSACQVTVVASDADPDEVKLNGEKCFVIDGCVADIILVVAQGTRGVRLYVVDASADGLTRSPMSTLDLTRGMARVEFADTPARLVGNVDGRAIVRATTDFANAAIAAEQLGGAERCLEASVEYATIREQFGRPIGSFQAIKHKCADMLLAVECARSAIYHLAEVLREDPDGLMISAPMAKAYCSDAYAFVAAENLHIHGGMGFTWEHDAHLYLRRAQSTAIINGDSGFQRRVLADRLHF
jgi:alkylation response protein AidB-like acyl-CoA dehydrogenase